MDRPASARTFAYPWRAMAGMAGLFVLVHAVYYALGLCFDRDTLGEVMHFLDPELLRTRLSESLWHLHIQPPLMNLYVGLILKTGPLSTPLFCALYLGLGLTLYLCTFVLQLRLGVHRKLAAVLSTLFMASPSFVIWEHYLLYTMPCAALLALASVLLFEVMERRTVGAMAAFFFCIFLLCGLRSMFHWVYFAAVILVGTSFCAGDRKKLLAVGGVPFVLVLALYLKGYLLFGEFGVCTFAEKNLWIMTVGNMNGVEKVKLVDEGVLSELSLVNRWASLDAYPERFKEVPERFRGIPALTQTHKANGAVNYNHYGNIAVCDVYGHDAKVMLRRQPKAFLYAVALSGYRYFKSGTALPVSPQNQEKVPFLIACYDNLIYGKFPFDLSPYSRLVERAGNPPYLFLLLGLPLVCIYGLYRSIRPGPVALDTAQRAALLFIVFNILYVALLGCTFDFTDGARYRFYTDGLSVALLSFFVQRLAGKRREG